MNSKRIKKTRFLHSLSAIAGSGLVAFCAMGQDCYRVVDIVELGFVPNPFEFTFGLNDQHEAVGTYEVGDDKHAFLWLPAAAYNLAAGFHDLHTLAGLGTSDESAAFDINDEGKAVGWIKVSDDQVAVVWEIDAYDPAFPPLTYIDLSTYTATDDGAPDIDVPIVAWAISNDTPAVVIGDAFGLSECEHCPPEVEVAVTLLGFTAELGSDVLDELLPDFGGPCDNASYGRDINSTATPLTVGLSVHEPISPCAANSSSCETSKDAVHFSSAGVPTALADLSGGGSESRGVNEDGSIVGWGYNADDTPCEINALFWEDTVAAEFNLGTVTGIDSGDQTRAEAITEPDGGGDMIVVGSNETTQHALRWEGSGVTWTVVDLNDKIVNQCAGATSVVVSLAHDVSVDGWIMGYGVIDGDAHALILIPDQSCTVCCFADLDCSGIVGAGDLLLLLASWGECVGCPADLNCDGVVGAADLLFLLAAWGTCQMAAPTEIPRTVQDCYNKFYPNDMTALIACIEAIE